MIVSFLKIIFAVFFTAFVSSLELLILPFNTDGNLYHALAKFHSRGILRMCGIKVTVEGSNHLDSNRCYIYVSNHASLFDIPAVIAGIPDQIRIVYKKELERVPIFGWALKYGKTYISIERRKGQNAAQSLEEAAKKIRDGASVLLFPEGTRTFDGALQPFKRGPFNLAMRAGVPIVPVTIKGSYQVLPRHSWRINPGTITLSLDKPIESPQANGKETEFQLRDKVHAIIQGHIKTL